MFIDETIQSEIENIYNTTPENVHGVSLGYKYKNNLKTNEIGIVFSVEKKKPLEELSADELIPKKIKINNQEYVTDVKEEEPMVSFACFSNNDPNILKLRGRPQLITPLKGGQEIIQSPTGWTLNGYTVGTLGFFAVDSTDNRLVGVTNAHVVCKKMLYATERSFGEETANPYNTIEEIEFFNKRKYRPSSILYNNNNGSSPFLTYGALNIKRFSLMRSNQTNYTDVALLIMKPSIVSTDSYKIHKPDNEPEYDSYLPFATTSEINNLLISDPRLLSTGRTTGPKGWFSGSSCTLRVVGIGVSSSVGYDGGQLVLPFGDLIRFEYEDGGPNPVAGGDSGSVLIADYNGQRKIIGIVFAGNSYQGLACRIDRVASDLQIRAWDSSYSLNTSVPNHEIVVCDYNNSKSNLSKVQHNGSTYYQAGCTTNDIYEVM